MKCEQKAEGSGDIKDFLRFWPEQLKKELASIEMGKTTGHDEFDFRQG